MKELIIRLYRLMTGKDAAQAGLHGDSGSGLLRDCTVIIGSEQLALEDISPQLFPLIVLEPGYQSGGLAWGYSDDKTVMSVQITMFTAIKDFGKSLLGSDKELGILQVEDLVIKTLLSDASLTIDTGKPFAKLQPNHRIEHLPDPVEQPEYRISALTIEYKLYRKDLHNGNI